VSVRHILIQIDAAPGETQRIRRQEASRRRIEVAIAQINQAALRINLLAGAGEGQLNARLSTRGTEGSIVLRADDVSAAIGQQSDAAQAIAVGVRRRARSDLTDQPKTPDVFIAVAEDLADARRVPGVTGRRRPNRLAHPQPVAVIGRAGAGRTR
jgi:hypothetical protein